jgi:hypothetical protein
MPVEASKWAPINLTLKDYSQNWRPESATGWSALYQATYNSLISSYLIQ